MATSQLAESVRGPLRLGGAPVFLYHGLTNQTAPECTRRERKYWVSAAQFRDYLACLRAAARRVVPLGELWSSGQKFGQGTPPIVLTFDDGRCSDYEVAFPLLVEAGLRAEFFVNTSTVGTCGYLSWQQMREMQRAGMLFQSHSHDHVDLARLPHFEMERQLSRSKRLIEDRLGRTVEFLAAPYGYLSREVADAAVRTGYRAVCTSWSWPTKPGGRRINRVVIYAHTSLHGFRELLSGSLPSYAIRAARGAMLALPMRVVSRFLHPQESTTGLESVT